MGFPRVDDKEISPIYLKMYQQVADLPAIQNVEERILKDIREIKLIRYTYSKHEHWNRILINITLLVGHKKISTRFTLTGGEVPNFDMDVDHLVDPSELLDIFWDNVAYNGKRIKMHGLCKKHTIEWGAAPRNKNRFTPWMLHKLFNSDTMHRAKDRTRARLAREILAQLKDNTAFNQFAEELTLEEIVNKLGEFTYLPPETLHRAVDLMYVKTTMEK